MNRWLKELGVEKIFFGAGDRNSGLLAQFEGFDISFGLDERSLSFEAYGFAKASGKPVAICTTSGTGAAECLPAVIEAFYSDTKLIMITADRPEQLRETRAPQTINQLNLYRDFTRTFWSGVQSEFEIKFQGFPVHLNVEINKEDILSTDIAPFDSTGIFKKAKIGLAVFTEGSEQYKEQFDYLTSLNIHTYVEAHSNLKEQGSLVYERDLLKFINENPVDFIIKLGMTPVTKLWRKLNSFDPVIPVFSYQSEYQGVYRGERLDDLSLIQKLPEINFQDSWELNSCLLGLEESEPFILKEIMNRISKEDYVYIGNSMPIRYLEFAKPVESKIFCSRGANGIDGQISTAAGIARAVSNDVHCIIGDLTFLYDIGRVFHELPSNLIIHVIDNRGGRIFERVSSDKRMILEHQVDLNKIRPDLKIQVYSVNNKQTEVFWKRWSP